MAPIESIINADHITGAFVAILTWIGLKTIDLVLEKIIDRKILSEAYIISKKKIKAIWTKRNTISSTFEFSVYTQNNVPVGKAKDYTSEFAEQVASKSDELRLIDGPRWDSSYQEVKICYKFKNNNDPYRVKLNFIPEQSKLGELPEEELPLSSIGVSIEFNFEFGDLRSAIINLTAFAGFLQETLDDVYADINTTNARFVVAPIEKDLTMDDWAEEKQFDVSLLLRSEDSNRSVQFRSDRAEISSPTTQIDNETVEYIRATLLNYYL